MVAWLKTLLTRPQPKQDGQDDPDTLQHERRKLLSYYQDTFATVPGNAVLEHLCRTFHVGVTTFVPGDPSQTARNEGERNVVLYILSNIKKAQEINGSHIAQSQAD